MRSTIIVAIALTFGSLITRSTSAQDVRQISGVPEEAVVALTREGSLLYAATLEAVFAGSIDPEPWRSTAGLPLGEGTISTIIGHDGSVYVATYGAGVLVSRDEGETWQALNAGLPAGARDVVALARSEQYLYAGIDAYGVYRYDLGSGSGWTSFNTGLFRTGVEALTVSGDYVVVSAGLWMFVRPENAPAWTYVAFDERDSQHHVFALLGHGEILYVGTPSRLLAGPLSTGPFDRIGIDLLPGEPVVSIRMDGSRIYAGVAPQYAEYFICSSDDGGQSWEVRAHEFSGLYDMMIVGTDLYAARRDGLWVHDLRSWTSAQPDPTSRGLMLHQNVPNPFAGSTVIAFELSRAQNVSLILYDLQGREVRRPIDRRLMARGRHEVSIDTSTLASGVYLYRLRAEDGSKSRTLVVVGP